jgi:parallel beta-helix repeat protein
VLLVSVPEASPRTIIHVPGDQPTIQAGIGAAADGDFVLVAPGTYYENLNFEGKAITVASSQGPRVTIVNGQSLGAVVTFASGEGRGSVLKGFTLQHGSSSFDGGGIAIGSSSPTIGRNIITGNLACNGGGGIGIGFGSPLINGNLITGNGQASAGASRSEGPPVRRSTGNVIAGNSWSSASGGGISLFASGPPRIENNIIRGNSGYGSGGGMWMVNQSDATLVQDLVVGNSAAVGGGIYWLVPSGDRGPFVVNNTIAYNSSPRGPDLWANGFQSQAQIWNNIVVGFPGETPTYCDGTYSPTPPLLVSNNSFGSGASGFGAALGIVG